MPAWWESTKNFALTSDDLRKPCGDNEPHHTVTQTAAATTLAIHTYFRRIREQCHLPPVTSRDSSSTQLHRFRIDSTQRGAQTASVLGPGTPVTKANSDNTPFDPY